MPKPFYSSLTYTEEHGNSLPKGKENFFASQQDTDQLMLSQHDNGKYLELFNNYVENVY